MQCASNDVRVYIVWFPNPLAGDPVYIALSLGTKGPGVTPLEISVHQLFNQVEMKLDRPVQHRYEIRLDNE